MIAHHTIVTFVSPCLLYPYAQYFVVFFYGMIELTNIPLTFMDIFKYFKAFAEQYPLLNQFTRFTFATSFIFLRLICFPIKVWPFLEGSVQYIMSGEAHDSTIVSCLVVGTVLMTILQFMWGYKVFKSILMKGGEPKKVK